MTDFFRAGDRLVRLSSVAEVDVARLVDCRVVVFLVDGSNLELTGPDAIELVLLTKPSALEGRRLKWVRHAWAIHNLFGHPAMQILSFFRQYKLAILLHDATTPGPIGVRNHV